MLLSSLSFIAGLLACVSASHHGRNLHGLSESTQIKFRGPGLGRSLVARTAVAKTRSRCPPGCSVHGICNEEVGRCDCPRHFEGPSCATAVANIRAICAQYSLLQKGECRADLPCFNSCNGKGRCLAGICHCDPGYWGMDCSISWGPNGKPQLLDGKYKARKDGVKVYIYELPANITSWFTFTRLDRPVHLIIWQRLMAAGMRTVDGNQADYYFIPVNTRSGMASDHLAYALDYVRTAWPWWSKDQGHRHFVVATGDMGVNDFPIKIRRDYEDSFANLTWLSHWGLFEDHNATGWKAAHRPGKDIVMPAIIPPMGFHETPLNPANEAKAQAQGHSIERNGTLFFAGRICGDRAHPNTTTGMCADFHNDYSLGVRQAVYRHHHARKGFKLVLHSSSYLDDISSHKFCLAPVGGGYGKRQVLVMLMGCIPVLIGDGVMQPFQPEMDWSRFSVTVEEKDIPDLPKLLGSVSKDAHAAMLKRLRCAAQHMYYTSSMGSILGDDGRYDAFETLMEILRVRRDHPDVAPEQYAAVDERFRKFVNCDLDGPEPLPLCTHGKERLYPDRPACVECRADEAGEGFYLGAPGGMLCCPVMDLVNCPRVYP